MQSERTDCLIRVNELQFERTDCLIRGNELLIRERERIAQFDIAIYLWHPHVPTGLSYECVGHF